MLLLEGHRYNRTINSIAFSPDGRLLASCSCDNGVRLWDLATRQSQVIHVGHGYCLRSLTFTPDGSRLAWADWHEVVMRDQATGQVTRCPAELGANTFGLAFSPDGHTLAAAGIVARTWDIRHPEWRTIWQTAAPWDGGSVCASCLAWSPDGRLLAVGGAVDKGSRVVQLHDAVNGKVRAVLEGTGAPTTLAFSPDGTLLAASCENWLYVWESITRGQVFSLHLKGPHFKAVAFSPDGRFLAASRNDGTVRFWDVAAWRLRANYDWDLGPIVSLAFSPEGQRAACGSKKGKILVWDLEW